MENLQTFLEKIVSTTSVSAIITSKENVSEIEKVLTSNSFSKTENIDKLQDNLILKRKVFISDIYENNVLDWYDVAHGFSSGQIIIEEKNIRINPNYEKMNIIYILEKEIVEKYPKLLEVISLTLTM